MMIEKLRLPVSRIFCLLLLAVILFSSSGLEIRKPFLGSCLFFIGCILIGIGCLGRLWCSFHIAGYKTNQLVTVGPYSICRNPLYLFSLIGALGVGLVSETILIPFLILVAFYIYYPHQIKSEEKGLSKLHGKKFDVYMSTTPRFLPKLSLLIEPKEYLANSRIFRRHLFGAVWFIWLIGILEMIEALHDLGVVPVLFKIY